jgi:type II secretory pathway component PulF
MIVAGLLLLFFRFIRTKKGEEFWGGFLLRFPFIGQLVIKANLARFLRTWQLLLQAGIGVVKSIEVALPTINNPPMRQDWALVAKFIQAGDNMAHSLDHVRHLPAMLTAQLVIAQESGTLAEVLGDIAQTYQDDVNALIRSLVVLFEPLLIVIVGVIVGFLVFAMLMPIFSMDLLAR